MSLKQKRPLPSEPPTTAAPLNRKLQTVTLSAAYNIALQISLRVVTFVSNAFILRYISPDVLGLINVRLLLLYTTIQFISREAFRRTCAPNSKSDTESKSSEKGQQENVIWSQVVNITSLTIPISIVVGLICSTLWYRCMKQPEERLVSQYWYAIVSIYLSVIIELLAEPCYIYGLRNDFIRVKVVVEGIFQMVRCLLISAGVYLLPQNAILGFAFAQIVASTVYTLSYYLYFVAFQEKPLSSFMPSFGMKPYLNTFLLQTSGGFFTNTVLKQFLTEGERYIMTIFAVINLAEQGIYDVINNLGSLPARLVFQQIEENSYLLFSSIIKRDVAPDKQREGIAESLNICANLVRFMLLLGLLLFTYGLNCAELALLIYGGQKFISGSDGTLAVRLLRWHCFYIVFIALNGILESYSFSAMSAKKMQRFNGLMLIISAAFLFISLTATWLMGSEGFIVANCFNMLFRIGHSVHFIGEINVQSSTLTFVRQCLPDGLTAASFPISFVVASAFRSIFLPESIAHDMSAWSLLLQSSLFIASIGGLFLIHLVIIYVREKELVHFIRTKLLSKRDVPKAKTS